MQARNENDVESLGSKWNLRGLSYYATRIGEKLATQTWAQKLFMNAPHIIFDLNCNSATYKLVLNSI